MYTQQASTLYLVCRLNIVYKTFIVCRSAGECSRLSLLSAWPAVNFPASEHHHCFASTKLYCLETETHVCEQLFLKPNVFHNTSISSAVVANYDTVMVIDQFNRNDTDVPVHF